MVIVEAQVKVPLLASTAQGPFEDEKIIDPGTEPVTGRKVAQVCWDQVPLDRMQPTLEPLEVKTCIVPLSSVDVFRLCEYYREER